MLYYNKLINFVVCYIKYSMLIINESSSETTIHKIVNAGDVKCVKSD